MTQQELKEYIIARVFPNNAQEITGASLQDALLAIVDNSQNEEEATEALERLATKIREIEDNVAQNTDNITTKQDTLTLSVKDNGNIVIGNLDGQTKEFMPATPSGDPMHYAYEAVGAVYNATNADITSIGQYGETITHKAGHWLLNEIGDIDNEEMRLIYSSRYPSSGGDQLAGWFAGYAYRTNLMKVSWQSAHNIGSVLGNAYNIEVFNMGNAMVSSVSYSFYAAYKLYKVLNIINSQSISSFNTTTFKFCGALQHIRLRNLKVNAFFQDSPLLSKESLLYMINNCASNVTFTITLHPEVYAKCTDDQNSDWYDDVVNAIDTAKTSKGTTITLASA